MARIRSVKPEFWRSEDTATLPILAALTYPGLWNYADDEGRGRYQPLIIHSDLHGLRPDVTPQKTRAALEILKERGLIVVYKSQDGKDLYQVVAFKKHQHPNRPVPSKFPPPPARLMEEALRRQGGHTFSVMHGGELGGEVGEEVGGGREKGSPPADAATRATPRGEQADTLPQQDPPTIQPDRATPESAGAETVRKPDSTPAETLAKLAHEVDPTIPEPKAEEHIRQALERGVNELDAYEAIKNRGAREKLWLILDALPPPRNGRPKEPYRGPELKPQQPRRNHADLDARRAAADQKVSELDPETRERWTADALADAKFAKLSEEQTRKFVEAALRVRAAKAFGLGEV